MRVTSPKQRSTALRYVRLECFCTVGDGELILPTTQQEEVVMTSRPVGQEEHCFFSYLCITDGGVDLCLSLPIDCIAYHIATI